MVTCQHTFSLAERSIPSTHISGSSDMIYFLFEVLHPVTSAVILQMTNLQSNGFIDMQSNKVIFNKEIHPYCLIPTYIAELKITYVPNDPSAGQNIKNEIRGFMNFINFLMKKDQNITIQLEKSNDDEEEQNPPL
jgi:hypothetical protein